MPFKFCCITELPASLCDPWHMIIFPKTMTLFSRMSCEMRLPYNHFTNRGLRHEYITVSKTSSFETFRVGLFSGTWHFIMPYFSGAKQSSPGLHWKLHVFFISFQVRPMASDKKTRNWRAHRHHLWKMSAKWCDLNPCGIQTVSGKKKKKIKFSSIVFNSLSQESDLAASYSLYTFPVPAARNTSKS